MLYVDVLHLIPDRTREDDGFFTMPDFGLMRLEKALG